MRNVSRQILRVILVLLFGVGIAAFLVMIRYEEQRRASIKALWGQVKIGDQEATVRDLLGNPYTEFNRAEAPTDYYIEGYGRRERPITGKVLIYVNGDMVFYIWLREDGGVEDLFGGYS